MLLHIIVLVCALIARPSSGHGAKNIIRVGDTGFVSLVEIDVRGVSYGKCSLFDANNDIEVLYEDRSGEIAAKAVNPTILDAASKARICRNAASKSSEESYESRANPEGSHPPQDIDALLRVVQTNLAANQEYISNLRPRFGLFGSGTNSIGNNFGIPLLNLGTGTASASSLSNNLNTIQHYPNGDYSLIFGFPPLFGKRKR